MFRPSVHQPIRPSICLLGLVSFGMKSIFDGLDWFEACQCKSLMIHTATVVKTCFPLGEVQGSGMWLDCDVMQDKQKHILPQGPMAGLD